MLCHKELVVVFKNRVKIGRRLSTWLGRHVAVVTDDLQVQSEGFMTEQTEIPLEKQGESSCQLTLNILHQDSLTLNALPSNWNCLGLKRILMANKERIPASRS